MGAFCQISFLDKKVIKNFRKRTAEKEKTTNIRNLLTRAQKALDEGGNLYDNRSI